MTYLPKRKLFTVPEYYKLGEIGIIKTNDRVELLEGEIIYMSPIKSAHSGMVNRLTQFFIQQLNNQATIAPQNPIRLSDFSEPEPDIVVAKYREDFYSTQHPAPKDIYFLVEIANSSLEHDRTVKLRLYAAAGILEYWIVNIADKSIEIYTNPKKDKYETKNSIRNGNIISKTTKIQLSYNKIFPT